LRSAAEAAKATIEMAATIVVDRRAHSMRRFLLLSNERISEYRTEGGNETDSRLVFSAFLWHCGDRVAIMSVYSFPPLEPFGSPAWIFCALKMEVPP
jgi:hypothetical protein